MLFHSLSSGTSAEGNDFNMTEVELLKIVLSEMDQSALNNLLSTHGIETDFGRSLNEFLQREDVNEAMKSRFRLDSSAVSRPDTLKLALIRFVNRQNMTEKDLYGKCNISNNHYYQVRDGTIKRHKNKGLFFQFALALKLSYYEAVYLLNLAGHHFTPWMSMRDYIIAHCLFNKIYDFDRVNELLEKYGAEFLDEEDAPREKPQG